MSAVEDALARFRLQPAVPESNSTSPFKLVSTVEGPASVRELEEAWPHNDLPGDAVDLWAVCRGARLFEDVENGQWGLILLSPSASAVRTVQERETRPSDLKSDDVVLGEFLGDLDLLVLAPSEVGQRRILIALPLDNRAEWFGVGSTLGEFLARYFHGMGDKYWERQDHDAESGNP